jgi:hypothetical protein
MAMTRACVFLLAMVVPWAVASETCEGDALQEYLEDEAGLMLLQTKKTKVTQQVAAPHHLDAAVSELHEGGDEDDVELEAKQFEASYTMSVVLSALGLKSADQLNASTKARYEQCQQKLQELKANRVNPDPMAEANATSSTNSTSGIAPVHSNAYCPASQRYDISAINQAHFTLDGCYIMSCFFYSGSCGPYFYTSANNNGKYAACKCCTPSSPTFYQSSQGNNVYQCR